MILEPCYTDGVVVCGERFALQPRFRTVMSGATETYHWCSARGECSGVFSQWRKLPAFPKLPSNLRNRIATEWQRSFDEWHY